MRYHGNYCGPGWSAGEYQSSVVSDVPAIDEFDATCRLHDAKYALGMDLNEADFEFYEANIGRSVARSAAAIVVEGQRRTRNKINMSPTRLRGAPRKGANNTTTTTITTKSDNMVKTPKQQPTHTVTAPASIGTVLRGSNTTTSRKGADTLRMTATVCVGRPTPPSQSLLPEMNAALVLNPVSVGSDEVQNMTRVYQRYRIHSATIHYRPIAATTTGGEVMIISNSDPNYKPVDTANGTSFYQRALSTRHSTLTPIWMPVSMALNVDTGVKVCDNLNSSTLEDFASGIVYMYQDGNTAVSGWFLLDLDIEFFGLRFNPRNLISGSRQGLGTTTSVVIAAGTLGSDAVATVSSGVTQGDIYLAVLSTTGSAFGGSGVNASTIFAIASGGLTSQPFTLDGSTALYARATSSTEIVFFTTYDSAVGYDTADRLLRGGTSTGSNSLRCVMTQLRNSTQPTF